MYKSFYFQLNWLLNYINIAETYQFINYIIEVLFTEVYKPLLSPNDDTFFEKT